MYRNYFDFLILLQIFIDWTATQILSMRRTLVTTVAHKSTGEHVRTLPKRLPKSVISIQSHVCFGAAGNSAAVFPMRRLGCDVWPINTVQFSNHTQYGKWEGLPTPTEQIGLLAKGIEAIGGLSRVNAVLSGYLGTPEQGDQVLDCVARVKRINPEALYVCDPVMGHPAKGCVVPAGVRDYHRLKSAKAADVLCPNVLELGILTDMDPRTPSEVLRASRSLIASGSCRLVLVKHLAHAGLAPKDAFEMLLVSRTDAWHVATPLLPFTKAPVGVGDLTSALLTVGLLHGRTPKDALEHTAAAYFHVMQVTSDADQYELQLVAAQDGLVDPPRRFEARWLPDADTA
jgi:pyridoxine kinase